jgi:hypothetical protein
MAGTIDQILDTWPKGGVISNLGGNFLRHISPWVSDPTIARIPTPVLNPELFNLWLRRGIL